MKNLDDSFDLIRFVNAQDRNYESALSELRLKKKTQPLDVVYISAG